MRNKNSNQAGAKQKNMGMVYIFLGLCVLLFAFAGYISLPLDRPVDLGSTGAAGLDGKARAWYTLEAEDYSIGPDLGFISLHNSFLPFISTRYTYYLVTVDGGGNAPFSMAVRVCGAKAEQLARGERVSLYGMVSGLTEAQAGQLAGAQTVSNCLNDNGDNVVKRGLKSAVFFLLGAVCIFLIVKLARRT